MEYALKTFPKSHKERWKKKGRIRSVSSNISNGKRGASEVSSQDNLWISIQTPVTARCRGKGGGGVSCEKVLTELVIIGGESPSEYECPRGNPEGGPLWKKLIRGDRVKPERPTFGIQPKAPGGIRRRNRESCEIGTAWIGSTHILKASCTCEEKCKPL